MKKKLTLSLDPQVIKKAKQYAKARQESLSHLVEEYFLGLTQGEETAEEIGPITRSLTGVASSNKSERELITEYLEKKYL